MELIQYGYNLLLRVKKECFELFINIVKQVLLFFFIVYNNQVESKSFEELEVLFINYEVI